MVIKSIYPRSIFKGNEDLLWSVLYVRAPIFTHSVVFVEECNSPFMTDFFIFEKPFASSVKFKPSVTLGDIGPFLDRIGYVFVKRPVFYFCFVSHIGQCNPSITVWIAFIKVSSSLLLIEKGGMTYTRVPNGRTQTPCLTNCAAI